MAESKKASLTVLGGPRAHASCEIPDEGTVTIGSGEGCTLQLDLPGVSALHAAVAVQDGRATVFGYGTDVPIHVNDNPVDAAGTVLRNGDILWLGMPGDEGVVMLQCILPRPEQPAASAATVAASAMPEVRPHTRQTPEPTPDIETTALDLGLGPLPTGVSAHFEPPPAPAAEGETFDEDAIETLPEARHEAEEGTKRDALILEGDTENGQDLVGRPAAAADHAPEHEVEAGRGFGAEQTFEPEQAFEPEQPFEAEQTFEPEGGFEPESAPGTVDSSTVMFHADDLSGGQAPSAGADFEEGTFVEPTVMEPTVVQAETSTQMDGVAPTIVQSSEPTAYEVPSASTEVEFEDETLAYPAGHEVAPTVHLASAEAPTVPAPVEPLPTPAPPTHATPPPAVPPAFVPEPPRPGHPSASMGPTRRESLHGAHAPARAHAPAARKSGGSRTGLVLGLLAAGVVVLAGVGYVAWRMLAGTAPAPRPTPAVVAQATPLPTSTPEPTPAAATPEPAVSASTAPTAPPVTPTAAPAAAATPTPRATPQATPSPRATPTPTPRATPTPAAARPATVPPAPTGPSPAQQAAAQAQQLAEQAEAALAARQFDAAISHADAALKAEPGNARATAARAEAVRRRDLARRRFTPGQTVVETQKAEKGGGLTGFDSGDADLRKAPDFQGRIEFEMSPASGLDAGAAWTLRAFVVNEGKKPIRVQGVTIATKANGTGSGGAVSPKVREIAPQQRALVGETAGTWADGTTAWSTEVTITANKGDSLRNTLTWR